MTNLWRTLSNRMRFRSAYQGMKGLGIEDSVDAPFLDVLRQFAATPAAAAPVPVALIEAFNKAQLRKKSRRSLRITVAALLGGIILIPGLAYAGVLPPPVARMVQRVFNVAKIPITLPASTTANATGDATASPASSNGSDTLSTSPIPNLGADTVPGLASILPPLLPNSTSVDAVSTWGVASPLSQTSSGDGSDTPAGDTQVNPSIEVTLSPDATPTDEPSPTDTPSPDATPTDEPSPTDTPSPDATPTDEPSPTDTPQEILPTP